ncbi:LysR family transcriptional regulator [Thalassotalea agarivorans]|uniref:DNA-binding transcriptional regulator, LysR family n=1 Tax=Thalassotalea agarivorans TaxID=349064 RepID=A0A1I0G8P1_THASX|nr:LysR family transcriptional regulator [Thalassotalea agarivorans]SET67108.1 DNA-binding transcriptional regulator, LysR family [Thalassotalea agarivorans]
MLNPVWLETFITLVDTGHFTQTAEKLFMTQPGVSQHVQKLEAACGHTLIKRDKKSFTITEQGQLVYQYTKGLLRDEKVLFEQLNFDDPVSGKCSMACSGSVALMLFPRLLKLQNLYPNIHINLKAAPNHQILSDIKSGNVDQGIVTDKPNESFFDFEELGQDELCLIFPVDTDVSKSWKQLLLELGLISHPDAEHYLSLYLKKCEEQELKLLNINEIPIVGSINQISQILEPLTQGIGFTVLPKSAVDSFHSPGRLKVMQPKLPVKETLFLVRKKNRTLPARYDAFNSIIRQAWA